MSYPHGAPPGTEVWVADGCDRLSDLIATKWAHDIGLSWDDSFRDDLQAYADEPPGGTGAVARQLARRSVQRVVLYVEDDCDPEAVQALAADPKVLVVRVPPSDGSTS